MDVNHFGSAFMPINASWGLTCFLLGGDFPSGGSVGAQISPWVELAATSGKCRLCWQQGSVLRCSERLAGVSGRKNSALERCKLSWQAERAPCAPQGWVGTSQGPFL